MQTESQIISSSLIRDDRETRKTKRRRRRRERERRDEKKLRRTRTTKRGEEKRKKEKKEERKRIIHLLIVALVNTRLWKLTQFRANKRCVRHPINSTLACRYLSNFWQIYKYIIRVEICIYICEWQLVHYVTSSINYCIKDWQATVALLMRLHKGIEWENDDHSLVFIIFINSDRSFTLLYLYVSNFKAIDDISMIIDEIELINFNWIFLHLLLLTNKMNTLLFLLMASDHHEYIYICTSKNV